MASLEEAASAFDEVNQFKPEGGCEHCEHCETHSNKGSHHQGKTSGKGKQKPFDLRKTSKKTKSCLRWGIRIYQLTNSILYCTVRFKGSYWFLTDVGFR